MNQMDYNEQHALASLQWDWNKHGTFCDRDAELKLFPELEEAWNRYKLAERQIGLILKGLEK